MKSLNVLDNTNVRLRFVELWDNDYYNVTVWCCRGGRWRRASSRRSRWRSYPLRGRGRRVRGLVGFTRGHTAVQQPPRAGDRAHPQVRTLTLPSTSHQPSLPNIWCYLPNFNFACRYPALRNFHFTTYPTSSSSSSLTFSSPLFISPANYIFLPDSCWLSVVYSSLGNATLLPQLLTCVPYFFWRSILSPCCSLSSTSTRTGILIASPHLPTYLPLSRALSSLPAV